jgi:hypothetical protein
MPSQVAPHLEQAADSAADAIQTGAAVVAEHAQPVAEDVAGQINQSVGQIAAQSDDLAATVKGNIRDAAGVASQEVRKRMSGSGPKGGQKSRSSYSEECRSLGSFCSATTSVSSCAVVGRLRCRLCVR